MRPPKVIPPTPNGRRRRRQSGFSIIEALVAVGVLGIGLLALINLHTSAIRGMKAGADRTFAMEIANQAIESYATQPFGSVTCPSPTAPLPWDGCVPLGSNPSFTDFNTTQPTCSGFYWGSLMPIDVPGAPPPPGRPPSTGGTAPLPAAGESDAATRGAAYRIDVVSIPHPDANNHPSSNLLQVFVCWKDEQGFVKQVGATRIVPLGI